VYNIWEFFREIYKQKRSNELLSMQKNALEKDRERNIAHMREVEGLKHDYKNQNNAIQTYLEHGRLSEALEYVKLYTERSDAVTEKAFSDNIMINTIAGELYQKAGEYGIKVELDLKAAPKHISDMDVNNLLANLTNNAVEACLTVPESRERFIRLRINRHEPYLNIRCVNSKAGEIVRVDGKIQTTKTESGHGIGLQAIEKTVAAYDGLMNIEHDENTFTVTLALKDHD
jgi:sensor histidine kinase regulating citrate/malate metabolism